MKVHNCRGQIDIEKEQKRVHILIPSLGNFGGAEIATIPSILKIWLYNRSSLWKSPSITKLHSKLDEQYGSRIMIWVWLIITGLYSSKNLKSNRTYQKYSKCYRMSAYPYPALSLCQRSSRLLIIFIGPLVKFFILFLSAKWGIWFESFTVNMYSRSKQAF